MPINNTIIFTVGLIIGIGGTSFAGYSALVEQANMITHLKEKVNLVPVVTVDALGICKVTQGGKSYMLIDVTNETKALDVIEQNINKEK